MKIDPHLTLVKGLGSPTQQGQPRPSPESRDGVMLLISQENRRARQPTPASLEEARQALETIQQRVRKIQEETLARVHHLEAHWLVKLR